MDNIIIILNYNDFKTTNEFVNRIKNFSILSKIIIVDNLSTDNSYKKLVNLRSNNIDVIRSDKNGGYAYGNNFGIKYAIKKYNPQNLIISNPDIIIDEKVIINLINIINKENNIGIVTAIMCDKDGKDSSGIAWKLPKYKDDLFMTSSIISKIKKPLDYDKEYIYSNEVVDVDVVPGSFFIINSIKIQEINFLDEDTFLYCEERILSYKMKEKGYRILLSTNDKFIHNHSVTINKNISSYFKRYDILKDSKIIYMRKYLKVSERKIKLFEFLHNISKIEKFLINIIRG